MGYMRIVGGQYGSRHIGMPKGAEIRPTQDKVREAVFNILGDMADKRILDLFAGSGAFGLEALSRGASYAVFVENNFRCVEAIRQNIESLKILPSYYDIIKTNAISVFPRLANSAGRYDLVFMDPPYRKDLAKKCLINLDSCDILTATGFVIAESHKKDELPEDLHTLIPLKVRAYGDTNITIYRRIKEYENG